ncbi:hypothetical protein GY45DRAFT_795078 [Cubamyces sp. BRFM 1775]|nr:hypothetical protein GY45DRAFT_795078 [Cubamyces sp. BRFM 1775]
MDRNTRANSSASPARPSPSDVGRSQREVDGHTATRTASSQGPESHNATIVSTPTAGNTGHIAGTTDGAHTGTYRSMQGQRDGPHPYAHLRGLNPAPTPPPPVTPPQTQCFQIPLPIDTDPKFKIDIISFGRIGFQVQATTSSKDHIRVAPGVARSVDNATMLMEHVMQDEIYVQRVYFALENSKVVPKLKSLQLERQYAFTLGHLITMLQIMQSGHWYHSMKGHNDNLRYITGMDDGVLPQEYRRTAVKWSDLWAIAIRRRMLPDVRKWCYFFELEVRL